MFPKHGHVCYSKYYKIMWEKWEHLHEHIFIIVISHMIIIVVQYFDYQCLLYIFFANWLDGKLM